MKIRRSRLAFRSPLTLLSAEEGWNVTPSRLL